MTRSRKPVTSNLGRRAHDRQKLTHVSEGLCGFKVCRADSDVLQAGTLSVPLLPTYYGGLKQDVTAGTIFRFSGTVRNLTESGVVTADEAQAIATYLAFDRRSKPDLRPAVDRLSPMHLFSSSARVSTPWRRSLPERRPSFDRLSSIAMVLSPKLKGIMCAIDE